MSGVNSFDPLVQQATSVQESLLNAPPLSALPQAPEASMFSPFGVESQQLALGSFYMHMLQQQHMQQMMQPQFLLPPPAQNIQYQHAMQQLQEFQQQQQLASFMQQQQMPPVPQMSLGPIQMFQQLQTVQSTPRRAYLKRKRDTPTPKHQTAAGTPSQTTAESSEPFPEVNFNDHSAYKRLLSSVWDCKGDPPWSRYNVQQLCEIVKTPSSWAPEWDGQDIESVLAQFDWHALKIASSRKRDILYDYVSRAVRCLWEDVHARAGLFRSTRDAYGNLREPMRVEFKSPGRLLPMRLDVNSSFKDNISSSASDRLPQTIKQDLAASVQGHDDAVAVLAHSLPISQSYSQSPFKESAAAIDSVHNDEGAEAQAQQDTSNNPSAQQQVPAFQDYCMLRVFVSWPPPPPDCPPSLQQSWYRKPLSKLQMQPLRLVAEALPNLRKEMLWYIACKKEMFAENDEFRLVPGKRKLIDCKYVSLQPEEEFVFGDCTYIEIAKPTSQALQLLGSSS